MESVDILVYFGQYFPTARSWVSRIKKKIPIWIFNIYIGSPCRSKGLFPPVFAFCSLLATSGHCQSLLHSNLSIFELLSFGFFLFLYFLFIGHFRSLPISPALKTLPTPSQLRNRAPTISLTPHGKKEEIIEIAN